MISVAIMAHPKRKIRAENLYKIINRKLPTQIVYDEKNDEWDTGKRAILAHNKLRWHMVIQDDAIIGDYFCDNVMDFLPKVTNNLVSFYFGTGRPHPIDMEKAVAMAKKEKADIIETSTLFWGVCIAFPTKHAYNLSNLQAGQYNRPYDNRIGHYFENKGIKVLNTFPSLVDHEDRFSLIHCEDKCKRKAFQYCPYRIEFNMKTVQGL
jgi:hypothetical protein